MPAIIALLRIANPARQSRDWVVGLLLLGHRVGAALPSHPHAAAPVALWRCCWICLCGLRRERESELRLIGVYGWCALIAAGALNSAYDYFYRWGSAARPVSRI
ncbi:MAG: hypothetical protein IPK16_03440 [Anaerolineales bacterium]|nr:hypothetical protein [Anaerolineales bacterium]